MRRNVLTSLLVLVVAATALIQSPLTTWGCASAPPDGQWVRIEHEMALIVWQPVTKTEHFIRRATFNSMSKDFGFLVPTPTQPELGEVESYRLFPLLDSITYPKYEEVIKRVPRPPTDSIPMTTVAASPVRVIEEKSVAGYDATVLQADDPDSLGKWLKEHGYSFRPALRDWLERYTTAKWYITAFKVSSQQDAMENFGQVQSKAVRMSFHTERPFYPYREPEDMRDEKAKQHSRYLRLFVLADRRMDGSKGDEKTPWSPKTVWANSISPEQSARLQADLKLPIPFDSPTTWLTEFRDDSSPRIGTDEVFFSVAKDQSVVEKPRLPLTVIEYYDPPSAVTVMSGNAASWWQTYWSSVVMAVGGLMIWMTVVFVEVRRRRRQGMQAVQR